EIDGASNRGIDEIRQLRQNVNVRPSRTRFKIYIIDEVHMLTREAFNALLKTLEEPPEHVTFFFCTTEPSKIPITILSRCQRFDFAGIQTASIRTRLAQIADAEGVATDGEALDLLARRAAGSMRDAQSLLEQLLSFAPEKVTAADVHAMLGTAGEERLHQLVACLVERNPAGALAELDAAARECVDSALLLEQLFCFLRDALASAAGCPAEILLYAAAGRRDEVADVGRRLGLHTLLAAMQILDQTLARLRYSTQGRILAELAVVRICLLDDLDDLAVLIEGLRSGAPGGSANRPSNPARPIPAAGSPPGRSMPTGGRQGGATSRASLPATGQAPSPPPAAPAAVDEPATATPAPAARIELSENNATEIWSQAVAKIDGMAADQARRFDRVCAVAADRLSVHFRAGDSFAKSICEQPPNLAEFEKALSSVCGGPVRLDFVVAEAAAEAEEKKTPAAVVSPHLRLMEVAKHPMIRRAGELFGATPTEVIEPPDKP
ncbi:MAG: DNA polymerase III subunit gamma/tau, partial [Pirellulales bacterium]|nr:DNA polymerase III subunit gamma/tau [Pirellulales bacterium]